MSIPLSLNHLSSAGDQTQGFVHAKQVLYHLNYTPSSSCSLVFFFFFQNKVLIFYMYPINSSLYPLSVMKCSAWFFSLLILRTQIGQILGKHIGQTGSVLIFILLEKNKHKLFLSFDILKVIDAMFKKRALVERLYVAQC